MEAPGNSAAATAAVRLVSAPDGRKWSIQERERSSRHLLVAAWEHVTRSLKSYPADWATLSDTNLFGLFERPIGAGHLDVPDEWVSPHVDAAFLRHTTRRPEPTQVKRASLERYREE